MSEIENYRFLSNRPIKARFKYDEGRKKHFEKSGEAWDSTSYGVEIEGKEYYINASDALAERINKYIPLKAKTLLIEKATEINRETGKEITIWGACDLNAGEALEVPGVSELLPEPPTVSQSSEAKKSSFNAKALMADCIAFVGAEFDKNKLPKENINTCINTLFMRRAEDRECVPSPLQAPQKPPKDEIPSKVAYEAMIQETGLGTSYLRAQMLVKYKVEDFDRLTPKEKKEFIEWSYGHSRVDD